jgi:hypothetical protein
MFEPRADGLGATLGSLDLGTLTVVSESDSLERVARTFLDRGTSCAVLDEAPLRVVTERDLAAAWAQGRAPEDDVALISSENPYWVSVWAYVIWLCLTSMVSPLESFR